MKYEKIIKDERGRIRFQVRFVSFDYDWTDRDGNRFRYDVTVWHAPKGKRTEIVNPEIATPDEIFSAKMELWNLIKPLKQNQCTQKNK